jgi:hypothetical protein
MQSHLLSLVRRLRSSEESWPVLAALLGLLVGVIAVSCNSLALPHEETVDLEQVSGSPIDHDRVEPHTTESPLA